MQYNLVKIVTNAMTNTQPLYIHYSGPSLLETPLLNKGSAFSRQERIDFNLTGLLPTQYETILEQADRAYSQYCKYHDAINKHIYLRGIQDNNETLFYALVSQHLEEMMPIIYTPTVGDACEQFSDIYRSSRGLFLAWEERGQIDDVLRNATKDKVKVIVVTDGERILGLGDQGIGGMGIPIGKLSLYTACGGISPAYTLPVMLDVGTNNENLLSDPMYMGARHPRVSENEYDEFIELFMRAAERRWPGVLIQFEDFAQANAMPVLNRYRERFCCFNDDIQGTAAVSLGTLLAACRVSKKPLEEQRIAFVGAGSAGCGIAEMLIRQMINEGLSDNDARRRIFMIDRHGLITEGMSDLQDFQCRLAQRKADIAKWSCTGEWASLEEVVAQARPTILIGVSGQPGLFTEPVIRTMAQNNESPIIFPLSNPVSRAEATAENIIRWTDGKAIIATGSPFEPVPHNGELHRIAQCNNSYIFPGIGLGILAVSANRVSDEMLLASSEVLAEASPKAAATGADLLPPLQQITEVSKSIAFAVAKVAQAQGHALKITDAELHARIDQISWTPHYRNYKRVSR